MQNNITTSPVIVHGAELALTNLEKLVAKPLPITREDDWAITRAINALRDVVDANHNSRAAS